jgi:hypothetical protein
MIFNMSETEKPKADARDVANAVVKAGISAIPVVGGPAAELFSFIFAPPLSKRRDEWVESLADGLKRLETTVSGFKATELSGNDAFVTTALHATQIALRNHQKEKLEMLRNAVLNASLPNSPEDDLQLVFLQYLDELTATHVAILTFFDDPRAWGVKRNVTYPNISMGGIIAIFEVAFPELRGKREIYDLYVKDLDTHGLSDAYGAMNTMMSSSGIFAARTTLLGKQFIKFITSPLPAE